MVREMFSAVKKLPETPRFSYPTPVFLPETLASVFRVVPVKEVYQIT